jgi:hypothetical protein
MKNEIAQSSASQRIIRRQKEGVRDAGQSTSAASIYFSATLLRPKATTGAKAVSWKFLNLPNEASDKLPSRGMVSVDGTLNGFPLKVTLEHCGSTRPATCSPRESGVRAASIGPGCTARVSTAPSPTKANSGTSLNSESGTLSSHEGISRHRDRSSSDTARTRRRRPIFAI